MIKWNEGATNSISTNDKKNLENIYYKNLPKSNK